MESATRPLDPSGEDQPANDALEPELAEETLPSPEETLLPSGDGLGEEEEEEEEATAGLE